MLCLQEGKKASLFDSLGIMMQFFPPDDPSERFMPFFYIFIFFILFV